MPADGVYFCSRQCLEASNEILLDEAREQCEDATFGPGSDGWEDWYSENADVYFPVRRRQGEEEDLELAETGGEETTVASDSGQPRAEPSSDSDSDEGPVSKTPPSQSVLAPLTSLLAAGNRVQECFKVSETTHADGQAWYGGHVGVREPDGRYPIGFDDGELRCACERELAALYSMNKLSAITTNGGLVADIPSPLKAVELCYMTCGVDQLPVGVFLAGEPTVLAGFPVYHSHVVNVQALAAALSSTQRPQPARASRAAAKGVEADSRAGHHTFRRGDTLNYKNVVPEDGIEFELYETCFGVMVVPYRKTQKLRFIVSYDSGARRFSVAPWTAWCRVSTSVDADLDVGEVLSVSGDDITDMETAWAQDTEIAAAASTLEKLKKLSSKGPFAVREARVARQREQDRVRKQKTTEGRAAKAAADARAAKVAAAAAAEARTAAAAAEVKATAEAKAAADARAAAEVRAAARAKEAAAETAPKAVAGAAARPPPPPPAPAPPPPPPPPEQEWQQVFSADGTPYYYHVHTRQVVWQLPTAAAPPPPGPPASSSDPSAAARQQLIPTSSNRINSSSPDHPRYGMSPTSFRAEIRGIKRAHYVLSQEMHEIVDPVARQRQAREIALLEARLLERGVSL